MRENFGFNLHRECDVQPDNDPSALRNRRYRIGILLVLLAMVALAAWGWWIPHGVFDPWVETLRKSLGIGR